MTLIFVVNSKARAELQMGFQSFTKVCPPVEDGQLHVQDNIHGCMAAQTGIQKHVLSDPRPLS